MKKTLFAVLATAMFAGTAFAESGRGAGFQLGYFTPSGGDLSDGAGATLGFGAHFFQEFNPRWTGLIELDLVQWVSKDVSPSTDVEIASTILGLVGKYGFQDNSGFKPYALVGLNIASNKTEVTNPVRTTSESNTRIGAQFGAGLEKAYNESWDFGADARYRTFGADGNALSIGVHATRRFGS